MCGYERVALEDHRDVAVPRREVGDVAPSIRIAPCVTSSSPASIRRSVDFPHPDGPTRTRNSPSAMERLDVVHRDDVVAEDLRDVVDLDRRHVPYRALSIVVLRTVQDQRGPQYGILVLTTQPPRA